MSDYCGNPACLDPECPGSVGFLRCPNYPHKWDGLMHCVVTRQIDGNFVSMNWQFFELSEAKRKAAELHSALNRHEHAYNIAILDI